MCADVSYHADRVVLLLSVLFLFCFLEEGSRILTPEDKCMARGSLISHTFVMVAHISNAMAKKIS